jgi:hypothetical protein
MALRWCTFTTCQKPILVVQLAVVFFAPLCFVELWGLEFQVRSYHTHVAQGSQSFQSGRHLSDGNLCQEEAILLVNINLWEWGEILPGGYGLPCQDSNPVISCSLSACAIFLMLKPLLFSITLRASQLMTLGFKRSQGFAWTQLSDATLGISDGKSVGPFFLKHRVKGVGYEVLEFVGREGWKQFYLGSRVNRDVTKILAQILSLNVMKISHAESIKKWSILTDRMVINISNENHDQKNRE